MRTPGTPPALHGLQTGRHPAVLTRSTRLGPPRGRPADLSNEGVSGTPACRVTPAEDQLPSRMLAKPQLSPAAFQRQHLWYTVPCHPGTLQADQPYPSWPIQHMPRPFLPPRSGSWAPSGSLPPPTRVSVPQLPQCAIPSPASFTSGRTSRCRWPHQSRRRRSGQSSLPFKRHISSITTPSRADSPALVLASSFILTMAVPSSPLSDPPHRSRSAVREVPACRGSAPDFVRLEGLRPSAYMSLQMIRLLQGGGL